MNDSPYLPSSDQWPIWPLMGKRDLALLNCTAPLTGYLDFWCVDLPIVEHAAGFAALGSRRLGVWLWRDRLLVDLCTRCQRHGCLINSTFDLLSGNVVDLDDCPRCLDAWIDSLRWPGSIDILPGTDPFGCRYIQHYRAKRTRE